MTKLLITAAAFAAMLPAQNNFQSASWLGNGPQDAMHALRPDGQTGPVIGKPFSGVETRTMKQTLSDGTPTSKTSASKIYRDAQGRTRSESGVHAMMFDAPNLMTYTMSPQGCHQHAVHSTDSVIIAVMDGSTWSSTQGHSGNGTGKEHANPHLATEDLGFQVINGISAQGTRQTLTIPGQSLGADHDIKVVNERWYSESLGILIKSSNVDPRFGSTTYELTEISQSSPDPSLFTAPANCN